MTPDQIIAQIREARAALKDANRAAWTYPYGVLPDGSLGDLPARAQAARLHLLQLETAYPYEARNA